MVGRSTVGWWEEYSRMVGRSTVGWWGGVQWDGGEEYSGMVGRSTVGWWGVQWDSGPRPGP